MADADYHVQKKKNQLTLHSGAQILLFRTWGAKQHEEGGSESFQRRVRDINKYINIVS